MACLVGNTNSTFASAGATKTSSIGFTKIPSPIAFEANVWSLDWETSFTSPFTGGIKEISSIFLFSFISVFTSSIAFLVLTFPIK